MPNETHVKRLIADAVFETHHSLHGQPKRNISREFSLTVAGVIFDALHRANSLLIDEPSNSNLKVVTAEPRDPNVYPNAPDLSHILHKAQPLEMPDFGSFDGSVFDVERKSTFGRVAVRLLFVAIIVGVGIGAYSYITGGIQLPLLTFFLSG